MIGRIIRDTRVSSGMTQAQLAGEDFSRSFISEVERGNFNPSLENLTIIAKKLGKPLTHFLPDSVEEWHQKCRTLLQHALNASALDNHETVQKILQRIDSPAGLPLDIQAQWHKLSSWCENKSGNFLIAVSHATRAVELYTSMRDKTNEWYCCHVAAHSLMNAGLHVQAMDMCHKAYLYASHSAELEHERGLTLFLLASCCFTAGRTDDGVRYLEEALAVPDQPLDSKLRLIMGRAACHIEKGEWERALKAAQDASSLATHIGDGLMRIQSITMVCECLIKLDNSSQAYVLFEKSIKAFGLTDQARREGTRAFLLAIADSDLADDVKLVARVKDELIHMLPKEGASLIDRWAIAKGELRLGRQEVGRVIDTFANKFVAVQDIRRAASVLEFGASLFEELADFKEANRLLRRALALKG